MGAGQLVLRHGELLGKLVTGVGAAFGKGDPVIVVGYVYTSEYKDKKGVRQLGGVAGHLRGPGSGRCVARIESRRRTETSDDGSAPATGADGSGGDDKTSDDGDVDDDDSALSERVLPLTA